MLRHARPKLILCPQGKKTEALCTRATSYPAFSKQGGVLDITGIMLFSVATTPVYASSLRRAAYCHPATSRCHPHAFKVGPVGLEGTHTLAQSARNYIDAKMKKKGVVMRRMHRAVLLYRESGSDAGRRLKGRMCHLRFA